MARNVYKLLKRVLLYYTVLWMCNQSESSAVNSWLAEKLIYVVLKLMTKCYYRMIYILNCVKLKLMVRFSLRCSLIIVAVDRSSQLFHLLFNWQVQKAEIHDLSKISNLLRLQSRSKIITKDMIKYIFLSVYLLHLLLPLVNTVFPSLRISAQLD